jgi:trans-2-enoyl-CoA reductase
LIVVLGQLAGLGIRDRLVRLGAWAGTSVAAAVLAAASAAAALIPYSLLIAYTVWRLTAPR